MKRARLIYNPSSGREEMKRRLPEVLQKLEQYGLETSCHATIGPGDAIEAARTAVMRGFDVVIAAGGDGTINEVINGLTDFDHPPILGILPSGTSNDFARAIGIPRNWDYACEIIGSMHTQVCDVGEVVYSDGERRHFLNVVGGGAVTELSYEVPSKLKTMLGQLAYYIKGLEKLPRLGPNHLKMKIDGELYENDVMLFLIANTNCVAGFEQLFPDAQIDDGLLDVMIVEKTTLPEFIVLATAALRGEHLTNPSVKLFRAKEVTVDSGDNVQLNVDGEWGGELPCTVRVLPKRIKLLVDSDREMNVKERKALFPWPFLRIKDGGNGNEKDE